MPHTTAQHSGERSDGDFRLEGALVRPNLGQIVRQDAVVHLSPKIMDVLLCLSKHAGELVAKDELFRTVWHDTFVTEHVLTHCIWQLRRALGNDAFIETVPRRGYRLRGSVWSVPQRIRFIVVLPLLNLTGDSDQEYFADGITESLITSLAQIRGIGVISRTSAMTYKHSGKPVPQIARELNVDGIIEGSVQRTGDRVRIAVQLLHAPSDQHLWAQTYDGSVSDLFRLQDDVARALADELQTQIGSDSRLGHRSPDPKAQEAYLKGRYLWNQLSQESMHRAIVLYREAIALDPDYSLPYIGLADVYGSLASPIAEIISPAEAKTMMSPLVREAIELDPSAAEALQLHAWIKFYLEWDWSGAEAIWKRIVDSNPNCSIAFASYGLLLGCLERHEEAIECYLRAHDLDPLSPLFNTLFGWTYMLAGQTSKAIQQLQQTLQLEPHLWFTHEVLGYSYLQAGRLAEAICELETAVQLAGDILIPRGLLGQAYAMAGRQLESLRIAKELEELKSIRFVPPALLASIHLGLRDTDSVLTYLEEAYRVRDTSMIWIRLLWNSVASDARFIDLVRRMNFPHG